MTVLQIEQILHNFEDPKIPNFFNLEQVNFRMTLVNCHKGDFASPDPEPVSRLFLFYFQCYLALC